MIVLPAASIVRSYLVRSVAFWIGARILLAIQLLLANEDPLTVGVSLTTVVVATVLGLVEIDRRRERALLGNLGVRHRDLVPVLAAPALVGETLLQIALGLLR